MDLKNKEIQDSFDFEARKHKEFFLPFYEKRGWKVLKDMVGIKNFPWDVFVETGEFKFTIDEKARKKKEFKDFLIELVQDLKNPKKSWFHEESTNYIFYASWLDPEKPEPSSAYLVNMRLLRTWVWKNIEVLPLRISKKGHGITLFTFTSCENLIALRYAEKII